MCVCRTALRYVLGENGGSNKPARVSDLRQELGVQKRRDDDVHNQAPPPVVQNGDGGGGHAPLEPVNQTKRDTDVQTEDSNKLHEEILPSSPKHTPAKGRCSTAPCAVPQGCILLWPQALNEDCVVHYTMMV